MGLFDSTLKIIRRWFFGMSDPTPTVFPVRAPETVFVQSLAEHDPFKLSKFSLTKSSLSRTDGVHEKLSLCFKEDGQNALYGLVADRTQPSRAVRANERQSLSRSSSDASVQVWDSRKEKDVNDCVRGFYPPAGNRWWASGSESDVFVADLHTTPTTRQHLTLLDVALVLRSVSDHKPHYVLVQENCWWFARCAGLLLEILAAEPTTQTTEALATDFFKRAPLPQLPFGIPASNLIDTERIICRDVREIRKLFNTYRATVQQRLEGNVQAQSSGQREANEAVERAQEETKRVTAAMEEQARAMNEETRRQVAAAVEEQARVMAEERRLHEEQTRAFQAKILELQRRNP